MFVDRAANRQVIELTRIESYSRCVTLNAGVDGYLPRTFRLTPDEAIRLGEDLIRRGELLKGQDHGH